MNQLTKFLPEFEQYIAQHDQQNTAISAGSVGWHIEHTLLVLNGVTNGLKYSDPKAYKWSFDFKRIVVLTMGKIPRGRGKAPSATQPKETPSQDSLNELLQKVAKKLKDLDTLEPNHNFNHPVFGQLNTKQTVRFLAIHTQHHLDIIKDILK
jgi:DinB superfamily